MVPFIYDARKTGQETTRDYPIAIGDVIADRYRIERIIASTNFSTVLHCLDTQLGKEVWVKVIHNQKETLDQGFDEIKIMKLLESKSLMDLSDKCIVNLLNYFYFREHLFIVSELLGENLYVIASKETTRHLLRGQWLKPIARQILTALDFIHNEGIIHADIKPENILITKPIRQQRERVDVSLIDFNTSCFTTDDLTTYLQSRAYRAPEVIVGAHYGTKIDIWSLGWVLYELETGNVLFPAENLHEALFKICKITGQVPPSGSNTETYFNEDSSVRGYEDTSTENLVNLET